MSVGDFQRRRDFSKSKIFISSNKRRRSEIDQFRIKKRWSRNTDWWRPPSSFSDFLTFQKEVIKSVTPDSKVEENEASLPLDLQSV